MGAGVPGGLQIRMVCDKWTGRFDSYTPPPRFGITDPAPSGFLLPVQFGVGPAQVEWLQHLNVITIAVL